MSLEREITAWDGKSRDDIDTIYQSHCQQPTFADEIIKLTRKEALQTGTTWLLKIYLESGHRLEKKQVNAVFRLLTELAPWEAKLHFLQSLQYMPVTKPQCKSVEIFLRFALTDTNKFVRAWTYNGFYLLTKQHPEYREETEQFFRMAMRDEAPSVKARIRNIMKAGF